MLSTVITGASFTGFTVTVNTWLSVNSPSDTDAVNVSEPLQFSKAENVNVFPPSNSLDSWTVMLTPSETVIDRSKLSTSSQ